MAKNTGKVREFCQSRKVGTLILGSCSWSWVISSQRKNFKKLYTKEVRCGGSGGGDMISLPVWYQVGVLPTIGGVLPTRECASPPPL